MYDAQANTISVDNIATSDNNVYVLRRLQRNDADDANSLWLQNHHDEDRERCIDYVPEGITDMGWLGYFIGKNEHLHCIYGLFSQPQGHVFGMLWSHFSEG